MKKELLIILLLLGLPTFFIMSLGPQSTGALVNGIAQVRVDQINLAMNFPIVLSTIQSNNLSRKTTPEKHGKRRLLLPKRTRQWKRILSRTAKRYTGPA